ncbi:MAG TPA: DUF983 domain-containing protein [Planctomycetota bacterium]|nr:DUF983 domain-containing protein [Planctomycetota bacterium]
MSLATVLRRSLALRCPRCGRDRLFRGLFRTAPSCAACGLPTSPEPGFYVGAIYLNYGATTILGLVLVFAVLAGAPTETRVAVAAVHCLAFPTLFFRTSRSLWLGIHTYRTLREGGSAGSERRGPSGGASMN